MLSKTTAPNRHGDLSRKHTRADQTSDKPLASCHQIVAFVTQLWSTCGQVVAIAPFLVCLSGVCQVSSQQLS